jgi:alanine racemase
VARIALALGKRAAIHVMIDSGMTRCGCPLEQLNDLLLRIESHTSTRLVSLGTHLATADCESHTFINEQLTRFRAATDAFAAKRPGKLTRTVANSGGIFFSPSTHMDMVRPGISLYGIDPTCKPSMGRPLHPVAKWVAQIVSILPVKAGCSVGYGQTWKSERDTRIGLVPVGYADGYMRCLGNRAQMLVNGQPVPVVGRVSMDLTTIDLHDQPGAQIGDDVIVMDDDPISPASAYALAELAGTIPYELFTRIGPRVKRVALHKVTTESTENAEKVL